MLNLRAPAKINLVLEVLGKRRDGYHEIKSIMQTVDLCDMLTLESSDDVSFDCSVPVLHFEDNLVLRAVQTISGAMGCSKGVRIKLEKHIPWGAGLGGGSSDAATTLVGLNRLWKLGLSAEALLELATGIGSDVPFFIYGGTCLVEGRGERLYPLPDMEMVQFVLLKPELAASGDKTKRMYGLLQEKHYTSGRHADGLKTVLQGGNWLQSRLLYNVFDNVAFQAFPGLEDYWRMLAEAGADAIHLAGSGPMLFTVTEDATKADAMKRYLNGHGNEAYLVSSIKGGVLGD